MADLRPDQLRIVSAIKESSCLLDQLWRAVTASGNPKGCGVRAVSSIYVRGGRDAYQLAGAVAAGSAEESEFGGSLPSHAAEPGLTLEERDSMGTRAKVRKTVENAS